MTAAENHFLSVAGCVAVMHVEGDLVDGEVKRVFIAPEQRCKGLASILMQRLEARLR